MRKEEIDQAITVRLLLTGLKDIRDFLTDHGFARTHDTLCCDLCCEVECDDYCPNAVVDRLKGLIPPMSDD